jgi:hypothetical protein
MRVFVYGYKGNMARRYRAVLNCLGHATGGVDLGNDVFGFSLDSADAVIVATPTPTHAAVLRALKDCGRPILCEKPISKDLNEVGAVLSELQRAGAQLQMVNQYAELDDPRSQGVTSYNYYRHGSDGLFWDCISLIRLARGLVTLREDSPIWQCVLNGKRLSLADMDQAYIDMISRWLKNPGVTNYDELYRAHSRTRDLEVGCTF